MRYPDKSPLPAPLPPEERTIGQLIAEAVKLYQAYPLRALALGLAGAGVDVVTWAVASGKGPSSGQQLAVLLFAGAPLYSAAFVGASLLVLGRVPAARVARAYLLAVLVFLPFPFLIPLAVLPALIWLALFGLSVPALVAEDLPLGRAVRRGLALGRVDFAHVLGGMCALVLVFFVVRYALAAVLHGQARNTALTTAALADLVLMPLVFLGSALLYVDQEARVRVRAVKAPAVA